MEKTIVNHIGLALEKAKGIGLSQKSIVAKFNAENTGIRIDPAELSRLRQAAENLVAYNLPSQERTQIIWNFLLTLLEEHGFTFDSTAEKFTGKSDFVSYKLDELKGRYNAYGLDESSNKFFITNVQILGAGHLDKNRGNIELRFMYGDEIKKITAEVLCQKQGKIYFTFHHEIFPFSAYINASGPPGAKVLIGVYWSLKEVNNMPMVCPLVLMKGDWKEPKRFINEEELDDSKIANFLMHHGGVFGLQNQNFYDEKDLAID